MNKDQILNVNNFRDFTQNQLVEMIKVLQQEVKALHFNRDYQNENLQHNIRNLETQVVAQQKEIEKVKNLSMTYIMLLEKPLTLKERITGKKIIG